MDLLKLLLLIVFSTAVFADKLILSDKEKEYLKNNPVLNLGYSLNFKPFLMKSKNGAYIGIAADEYELIAKKLGVKLNYIIDDWRKIHKRTKAGEIDVVPIINKTIAKKSGLLVTDELYDLRVLLYTKNNKNLKINSFKDLKKLKVAFNENIIILDQFLSKYKETINLVPVQNDDEIFTLLEDNEVDAAISFNTSKYILTKRILNDIVPIHTFKEPVISSVSGVRPDAPLLYSIISKAIASLSTQDKQIISKKWLGSFEKEDDPFALTKKEKLYLKNNTFTICEQHDIYPLSGVHDDKLIGMRGEYIKEIVKRTGIKLKVLGSNNLKELIEKADKKQCDMIGSLGSGQKIFPTIINTDTVMEFPYAIMGDLQSFNMGPYNDLSGHTFIVRFQNIKNRILSAYPNLHIEVINEVGKAIKKVYGNVHFIALKPVTERIIQDYGFDKYKLNGVLDKVNQKSTMGVHKDHPMLLSIINKTIAGTDPLLLDHIQDKYSIKEFKVVQSYAYLWYVVGITIVIALFLYYRSLLLQKKNKEIERKNIEIRQKDQLLFQQSKLAAMGEMIGAIAHQWRQPLNVLAIKLQKLEYAYKKNNLNEEYINNYIEEGILTIDFMSKTIDGFRNFFRVNKTKATFEVKKAIEEIANMQNAQLQNHHIILKIDGENFKYYGLRNEFQQVILNLISNSKDALILNNIVDPKITIMVYKDKIVIEDNGGGIKKEILNRIFEPYFTTKDQGEGTGIGLYMSKMVIEENLGGKLYLNNIEKGLRVTIELKGEEGYEK